MTPTDRRHKQDAEWECENDCTSIVKYKERSTIYAILGSVGLVVIMSLFGYMTYRMDSIDAKLSDFVKVHQSDTEVMKERYARLLEEHNQIQGHIQTLHGRMTAKGL